MSIDWSDGSRLAGNQQMLKKISKSSWGGRGDIFSYPMCFSTTKNHRDIQLYIKALKWFLGGGLAYVKTPPFDFNSILFFLIFSQKTYFELKFELKNGYRLVGWFQIGRKSTNVDKNIKIERWCLYICQTPPQEPLKCLYIKWNISMMFCRRKALGV